MRFLENVSLKNYTTFKIGGKAKYFFAAKNKKDLIKAIKTAKEFNLPFFILGGGSNLLVADKGFKGLVIKVQSSKFKIQGTKIIAQAGARLSDLISAAIKAGLSGIENGAGIPGTIGGAVYGNAGWPKGAWAIGDYVKEAELLMPDGKIKRVGKKWLSFGYRNSRLKILKNKPIILEVVLELKKGDPKELEKKRKEILETRSSKIPLGFSAGSVFKNPLQKSAGYLIDQCGLKGKKVGKAKISEKHANFIVNSGGAKAKDVVKLIKIIKNKVKKRFGASLEEEIQYLK